MALDLLERQERTRLDLLRPESRSVFIGEELWTMIGEESSGHILKAIQ